MRTTILAVFLCMLATNIRAESVLPSDRVPWIQVHTPHFLIYSNVEDEETRDLAVGLERQLESMTAVLRGMKQPVAVPNLVFVFRDKDSFEPYTLDAYLQPMNIQGYYLQSDELNQLVILLPRGGESGRVVHHEFTHLLLHSNVSPKTFPIWVDEGLAEYFSTFEADEGNADIGAPNRNETSWLAQHSMVDLRRMFAVKSVDAEHHEPELQAGFYCTAWATVHYLKQGPPGRQRQFAAFLDSLQAGLGSVNAFEKVFGSGAYETIGAEVKSHLDDGTYEKLHFNFRAPLSAGVSTAQPVGRVEILWRLGDLLAHRTRENHPAAEDHFRAALAHDSLCAAAYAGLGEAEGADEHFDQADRYFARALALAPHDPFVQGRCARNWVRRFEIAEQGKCARGGLPGSLQMARQLLQEALQLTPNDFSLWGSYGTTFLCGGDSGALGRAALDKAYAAMPFRTDLLMKAIYLEAWGGEADKAARRIAVDLKQRLAPDEIRTALNWVQEGRAASAGTASSPVEPGRGEGSVPSVKKVIQSMSEAAADRQRHWVELFNDATDQANTGNLHGAEKMFLMVADSSADAEFKAVARQRAMEVHNDNLCDDASMKVLNRKFADARKLYEQVLTNRPTEHQKQVATRGLQDLKGAGARK